MKAKVFSFCLAMIFAFSMESQAQLVFNYWSLSGNALSGPTAGSFLGTTNQHPLYFRTNSTTQMCIVANGNVGFGTTNPYQKIHVVTGISLFLDPNKEPLVQSMVP